MADINFDTDITDEMYSIVAEALLYRDDPTMALKKSGTCPKNWTISDVNKVYKHILKTDKLKQMKDDYIKLESETLVDDNTDTMMLIYNLLLKDAKAEQKYDVVARILKEIRQLKAIENEQMQFEITFKIQGKD
jgi:type III secretion system FlhB-like substrate exporter